MLSADKRERGERGMASNGEKRLVYHQALSCFPEIQVDSLIKWRWPGKVAARHNRHGVGTSGRSAERGGATESHSMAHNQQRFDVFRFIRLPLLLSDRFKYRKSRELEA